MGDSSDINKMGGYAPGRTLLIQASILIILTVVFLIELYSFAGIQDIWVDETTQLSGITLKLWEMLRWLMGTDLDRFGVPGDRMPPVSYLLDWSWLRLAGPSTIGFRLFHSVFVIAGAWVLAAIAWRQVGPTAAIVTFVFLVLSPKLIQTGVEIRAYPIFFVVTCVQLAVFLKLLSDQKLVDLKLLAAFACLCLVSIYTHFYGLVSTCAFFFALGIAFLGSSASLIALAVAVAFVMIGSFGLLPFVTSAVGQSQQIIAKDKMVGQYLVYFFRLFGDSANMVSVSASVSFLGGTLALLLAGAIPAFARIWRRKARSFDWLYVVVIAGALAPVLASFVVRSFNVTNPSYSGWLFAPLSLLVGIGATTVTGFRFWDHVGRFVVIGATLIGASVSTVAFLTHSAMFIHGPQRFVGAMFDRIEGPRAIVYESGAAWGFPYFPLVFSHDRKIDQYRAAENEVGLIRAGGGASQPAPQSIVSTVAPYNHLLLVDTQLRTYRDLREYQKGESSPSFARGVIEEMLIETGQWRESKVERSFGLYDTQVKILDRVTVGGGPT
jgi:hypothetical protein